MQDKRPAASQQDASEVDVLKETDRALSEDHENKSKEATHQQSHSRLDYYSLASLYKLIKWTAQRCTSPHSIRCLFGEQYIVHKILHQAQKNANIMSSGEARPCRVNIRERKSKSMLKNAV